VTWASAPADAAAVARDVSDRADGVSGLVDPAHPAHAPTGAVAAGDRRSVKRGCARWVGGDLTFLPTSAILPQMTSLLQTGSGMFSARAGRSRPGCVQKRFLVNRPVDVLPESRWLPFALLFAVGAVACGLAWINRFVQDDAFIAFAYARNFADGAGLTWFGDRIEGYTSFLWVLLVSAGFKLGIAPVLWAWLLSLVAFVAVVVLLHRLALLIGASRGYALAAVVLFTGNYSVSAYATSGMETMLQTALVCAVVWLSMSDPRTSHHTRTDVMLSLLSALALMTRLDSVVLLAGAFCYRLWMLRNVPRRAVHCACLLAPCAVLVGTWLVWKHVYYGRLLPNTFDAKVDVELLRSFNGFVYLGRFLHWYLIWPFAAAGLVAAVARHKRLTPPLGVLAFTVLAWATYVALVGGDFMEFRFIIPVAPMLFLGLALLIGTAAEAWFSKRHAPRAAAAACAVLLLTSWDQSRSFTTVSPDHALDSIHALATCYGLYPDRQWDQIGRPLVEQLGGSGVVLALDACGAIPFFSRLKTVDTWGLNDSVIPLKGNPAPSTFHRPGHRRYAPLWYLQQRGVNLVIAHPTLISRERFHGQDGSVFFKDWLRRCLPFNREPITRATLVGIPMPGSQCLLAWYLTPSVEVDRAMRAGAWEQIDVSDSNEPEVRAGP
jgi:arabinofuranosyltransferase